METIKILSDIEHVLQVPTRYIGSINETKCDGWILNEQYNFEHREYKLVPAFITLFREIISNSIDEFIRTNGEFSTKIDVKFDGSFFSVRDNGRGLPHKKEEKTKLPQSVVAFTQLKAGSNFIDDGKTVGMHGEGAALTNIFSKKFTVNTSDGVKKTYLECIDNLSTYKFKLTSNKTKFTEVKWLPDYQKLNIDPKNIDDDYIKYIKKIIIEMSLCYQGIKFTYNGKKIFNNNFREYVKKYNNIFEIFTHENVDIAILPTNDFEQVSFVNGIYTRNGGSHVELINNNIVRCLRELLIKRYKDIKPSDIKNKLFYIINIRNMKAPRFSSQVKEELINTPREYENELFQDIDFEKIAKKIKINKQITDNIIETFKIKEELKKRKNLENKEKKLKRKSIPKLIESYHADRNECSLYITEGKSATMNFLSCRDKNMAAYPLKGKFINCFDTPLSKILKNAEIQDILAATGLKLTSKSIKNLRYGKIVIFSDADYDGDAICCLLINFFFKFWPDLIKEGRLYRAITPLITAKNLDTNESKYFFNLDDFNESCKNENLKLIDYNKGLGSLSAKEYKFSLKNLTRLVIDDKSEESLNIAFGNNANLRKEWLLKK